jgi:hypothetical protein
VVATVQCNAVDFVVGKEVRQPAICTSGEQKMQIRFPFAFEAQVRQGEVINKVILGDWATVEVDEVAEDDAPIIAEFEAIVDHEYRKTEIRELGGDFYRPMTKSPHGRPYDIFAHRVELGSIGVEHPIVKTFFNVGWGDVQGKGNDILPPDTPQAVLAAANAGVEGHEILSSFREAVLQRNATAANDLISINGEVWERCRLPHFEINLNEKTPTVSLSFEDPYPTKGLYKNIVMPLSEEFALIEALGKIRALSKGRWSVDSIAIPKVSELADITMKHELPYLAGRARYFLEDNFGHDAGQLQHRSVDFIRSWANLKEAVNLCEANAPDAYFENLVARMKEYLASCIKEGPRLDRRDNKPAYGSEEHKARFDVSLASELAGWQSFMDRASWNASLTQATENVARTAVGSPSAPK